VLANFCFEVTKSNKFTLPPEGSTIGVRSEHVELRKTLPSMYGVYEQRY